MESLAGSAESEPQTITNIRAGYGASGFNQKLPATGRHQP